MLNPIKVVDIELSRPIDTIHNLEGYMGLQGLVRLYGQPIGYIQAPITNGCCTAKNLSEIILEKYSWKIIKHLLKNGLAAGELTTGNLQLEKLFDVPPPEYKGEYPLITVAICTRDRAKDLALCLDAISKLDYPNLDILIIDNAPSNDDTKDLVKNNYPNYRYCCEPRPGLDWARNRAIIEAKGEIIAYTDDDVVVDAGWVKALAQVFAENPEVMAVTGLVVPYELETKAQVLFEQHGGFGKGFQRNWYRVQKGKKINWYLLATGNFGTGANMAYRRSIFAEVGYFDPALDVGTITNGAGDLEMFFRIIKGGYTLVYEPNAIVRHRHRREYEKLRSQLADNGSVFAYFTCAVSAYPEELFSFLRLGIAWLRSWHIPKLFNALIYPAQFPLEIIWAELWGCIRGLTTYHQSRNNAEKIAKTFGALPPISELDNIGLEIKTATIQDNIGVRSVELTQPLRAITDVTNYGQIRIFVTWKGSVLGSVDIYNLGQPVSATRLSEVIIDQIGFNILQLDSNSSSNWIYQENINKVKQHYCNYTTEINKNNQPKLPNHISVSIVLATCNRPNDLRECLSSLTTQKTNRKLEIIVVDNKPESKIAAPIVAEFPGVILIEESRQGVAYARNAGIAISTGDIVVTTDDDTTMPPEWLEKLIAPFARYDVMCVTGNVLPVELETESQRLFEEYGDGGLGRGYKRFEVNRQWFDQTWRLAVPTWQLGGTANSAFRACIFSDPEIGLMKEYLGPGMPSGVGEDIYIFYKIVKKGYTIVYEPTVFVWHKHRRDIAALRRQLYGYSKGLISYFLTTMIVDQDLRALRNIFLGLPSFHLRRIKARLQRRSNHNIWLILLEISGHIIGPWALWKSYQYVKREGYSTPYIPVSARSNNLSQSETMETSQYTTLRKL